MKWVVLLAIRVNEYIRTLVCYSYIICIANNLTRDIDAFVTEEFGALNKKEYYDASVH